MRLLKSFKSFSFASLILISFAAALVISHSALASGCKEEIANLTNGLRVEREEDYRHFFNEEINYEDDVLDKMRTKLPYLYHDLYAQAEKEMAAGNEDFSYEIMTPVLKRIVKDLEMRKARKFGEKYGDKISEVQGRARELILKNTPYASTARFIFSDYLPLLDGIFGERHPELMSNNFHRENNERLLNQFLSHEPGKPPKLLLFFSFEPVNEKFFLQARAAPLFLIGLNTGGLDDNPDNVPFADGFPMKNSEFSWHDMGHVDFMWNEDFKYIKASNKKMDQITMEWEATRQNYMKFWDQFKSDKNLYDAMALILFEIVHERGYQYSLTVMKRELETPKWVTILNRKRTNDYYRTTPHFNYDCFSRLEEARQLLLGETKKIRIEAQLNWYTTINAANVKSIFIYSAPLQYGIGQLEKIEVVGTREQDVRVYMKKDSNRGSKIEVTDVNHILTPQVSPTKVHPLIKTVKGNAVANRAVRRKMNQIMTLIKRAEPGDPKSVTLTPDKQMFVTFNDGTEIPFDEFNVANDVKPSRIEEIRYFKMLQAIGGQERHEPLHYTIERTPNVMTGVGVIDHDGLAGSYYVTVIDPFTRKLKGHFDLTNIRIDTLNLEENYKKYGH